MRREKVIETIGEENWDSFLHWMRGQTCGTYSDGEIDFYTCDVKAFETKLKTNYDRQEDFRAFD